MVVFTVYPEISALKALHSLPRVAERDRRRRGQDRRSSSTISSPARCSSCSDIENSFAAKVTLEIPYEPVLYLKAVNEGMPVVSRRPEERPRAEPAPAGHAAHRRGRAGHRQGGVEAPKSRGLGGILKRG